MIGELLLTQKSKSANQYKDIDTSVGKQFRSYAEGQKVDWLDSLSIVVYLLAKGAGQAREKTRDNTIHSESGEVLRFLRWCKDRKYLREVSSFEKPRRKGARRPASD